MSRSSSKGYYVDQKLLEKIRKFSNSENNNSQGEFQASPVKSSKKNTKKNQQSLAPGSFKTWARGSVVHPDMIGKSLFIHNGKEHKEVRITSGMVGIKLGALSPTRKRGIHGKAGKR